MITLKQEKKMKKLKAFLKTDKSKQKRDEVYKKYFISFDKKTKNYIDFNRYLSENQLHEHS